MSHKEVNKHIFSSHVRFFLLSTLTLIILGIIPDIIYGLRMNVEHLSSFHVLAADQKRILRKELFPRSAHIANIRIDSIMPMVIIGVEPQGDNYLEWNGLPVPEDKQWVRLFIQGHVQGNRESCIMPRVTFWNDKKYLQDKAVSYPITGTFMVDFVTEYPTGATAITPRITFSDSCFRAGQQIRLDKIFLERSPMGDKE